MRRSAAPSVRKLSNNSTQGNENSKENITSKQDSKNTRSVNTILNILNKVDEAKINKTETDKKKVVQNVAINAEVASNKKVYSIVYGKKSMKKHKTWENDGFLEVSESGVTLKDTEGKVVGKASNIKTELIEDGYIFSCGSNEVQIVELLKSAENIFVKRTSEKLESSPPKKRKKGSGYNHINILNLQRRVQVRPKVPHDYQPLILPEPPAEHQWKYNTEKKEVVEVNLDPILARALREHQRSGLVFLYECVMGFKKSDYHGAILADEMGLGKTLQCIALIWTLLKKGPYSNNSVIKKILIVTPSSLTRNWEKEFAQWLGQERISTFVIDTKSKAIECSKIFHVPIIIISYEMFVRYTEELQKIHFDLMICDEGHRLKNNSVLASQSLNSLNCKRRIILSGTPIQNDLMEFYALMNFVNPGILDSEAEYRKYYVDPIKKSRLPDADIEMQELGQERAAELNKKAGLFILRRTQEILDKYLPTRTETVVFCISSHVQRDQYLKALNEWENNDNETAHFTLISNLKKICNHPCILDGSKNGGVEDSGKLQVLLAILKKCCELKEKIVIVSYFTQTLDMLSDICVKYKYKTCRLDGSTPSNQRTEIVDHFNSQYSDVSVFLLSAKAGGVGLNLIGASRLVMFDADWNPANDLQAMSRVWRDGQKKSVFLYRLVTTGTIEEKIYQRQIAKVGLSGAVVDQNMETVRLSNEELKDLFNPDFEVDSLTHKMLNCDCECNGKVFNSEVENENRNCQLGNKIKQEDGKILRASQLMEWEHFKPSNIDETNLKQLGLTDITNIISFIFRSISIEK